MLRKFVTADLLKGYASVLKLLFRKKASCLSLQAACQYSKSLFVDATGINQHAASSA